MALSLLLSLALVLAALALPAEGLARALVGPGSELLDSVVLGARILQGALFLQAVLLAVSGPLVRRARSRAGEPLLTRGLRPEAAPRRPGFTGFRTRWALLAIVVGGLALRLVGLGDALWFDEIDTLTKYLRRPLPELVAVFDSQNHHLLYSLLARATMALPLQENVAIRLPAALFGVLSLPATWRFLRRVAPPAEALCAAAILCVAWHHVWFSQNARGYTGLLLFTLLGSAAFLDLLSLPRPRYGPALRYGLWMALAVATHATAVLVVGAHGLVWLALVAARGRRARSLAAWPAWGFVLAVSFSVLAYALVLPQFVATLLEPTMPGVATAWKDPVWLVRTALQNLAAGLPGGWLGLGLGLALFALGLGSYLRQGLAVAAVLLLPAAATAAAIVALHHNLWPRFFFFSAAFGVALVVRGLFDALGWLARGRPARAARLQAAASVLLVLGGLGTVPGAWGPKQDFPGARDWVLAHAGPGEPVATADMAQMPYELYLAEPWSPVDTVAELESLERGTPTSWVLYTMPTKLAADFPDLWAHLQAHYREAARFGGTLAGGDVVVLRRADHDQP